MKVGIANDHAAVQLKNAITKHLIEEGYEVVNYGTDTNDSCDYPDFAEKLCAGYKAGEFELGIAICSTGVGISISCNKHKGIRACCCSETLSARLTREHNNANIICFGSFIVPERTAFEIVDTFLTAKFSEGERHLRRIGKIKAIEDKQ